MLSSTHSIPSQYTTPSEIKKQKKVKSQKLPTYKSLLQERLGILLRCPVFHAEVEQFWDDHVHSTKHSPSSASGEATSIFIDEMVRHAACSDHSFLRWGNNKNLRCRHCGKTRLVQVSENSVRGLYSLWKRVAEIIHPLDTAHYKSIATSDFGNINAATLLKNESDYPSTTLFVQVATEEMEKLLLKSLSTQLYYGNSLGGWSQIPLVLIEIICLYAGTVSDDMHSCFNTQFTKEQPPVPEVVQFSVQNKHPIEIYLALIPGGTDAFTYMRKFLCDVMVKTTKTTNEQSAHPEENENKTMTPARTDAVTIFKLAVVCFWTWSRMTKCAYQWDTLIDNTRHRETEEGFVARLKIGEYSYTAFRSRRADWTGAAVLGLLPRYANECPKSLYEDCQYYTLADEGRV